MMSPRDEESITGTQRKDGMVRTEMEQKALESILSGETNYLKK